MAMGLVTVTVPYRHIEAFATHLFDFRDIIFLDEARATAQIYVTLNVHLKLQHQYVKI